MSLPVWKYVDLKTVLVPDTGWHYDDDTTMNKLAASLQRHGQLQPLVVRGVLEDDSMVTLVRGHKLLGAMLSLGWTQAMAVHLGPLDTDDAMRVALHLELRFEVDYARLAAAIGDMIAVHGWTVAELAASSPFDAERIGHFLTLRTWDFKDFTADDGQARLDWDALEAALPEPLATVPLGTREAAQVVTIGPPLVPVTEPVGMAAALEDARRDGLVEPLEDVTEAPVPEPVPAAAALPLAETAEPAPQTATEAAVRPAVPAKDKPTKAVKVPKAPDAQMGLF